MSATRNGDCTAQGPVLYMALELSEKTWKLGFTTGRGQEPRLRDVPSRDVVVLEGRGPRPSGVLTCRRRRRW
jgi:hypothetical protein